MYREKAAILYICTGKYTVFWKEFYLSYEKYFLPDTEKHYYVFCDGQALYGEAENRRIHKFYLEHTPWPLPTLLRFWVFTGKRDELGRFDYIFLMNANVVCRDYVREAEYLPDAGKGERLVFTLHPGYAKEKPIYFPYERRKQSRACVPYNRGIHYVFGAMNGGVAKAYLDMLDTLNECVIEDLKKGVIPIWHDESYINKYILDRHDYKLLTLEYCHPQGWANEDGCKILGLDKARILDVTSIKEPSPETDMPVNIYKKLRRRACAYRDKIYPHIRKAIDALRKSD